MAILGLLHDVCKAGVYPVSYTHLFLAVEQAEESLGVFVVNVDDHVGVLDVVDPGDVLVADAFDAVAAEAVIQDGRALQRFADSQLHARITLLSLIHI